MVLANLVAMGLAALATISALFALLLLVSLVAGTHAARVPDKAILVIDLGMNITDSPHGTTFDELLQEAVEGAPVPSVALRQLTLAIDRAAVDPQIAGLFIYGSLMPENYGSGYAALSEVRAAITRFNESRKPTIAYLVSPSLRDYYIASAAKRVLLHPYGIVAVHGMAAESLYLAKAMDKYGIGVQVTRVGRYKSAVETFTSDRMSEDDREQIGVLLDDIWRTIVKDIAAGRKMPSEILYAASSRNAFFMANEAVKAGLADGIAHFDEVITELEMEGRRDEKLQSFAQVSLRDYINMEHLHRKFQDVDKPEIAVVYVEGEIVDGEGSPQNAGADRIARDLRALRQDDRVAGVVLRVNSPGGSAIASEVIHRELMLFEKPLVVSMGTFAASGGYWISTPANAILAQPTSITGSIGVFGLVFNVKRIANEHGVTFDSVKTSPFADIETITRPKTSAEMAIIQRFTDNFYEQFVSKVSEGRDMPPDRVMELAEGRVWSGVRASELNLTDGIGGLGDAIRKVATAAQVEAYTIRDVPERKTLGEALAEMFGRDGTTPPVVRIPELNALARLRRQIRDDLGWVRSMNDPVGVYARMPFNLIIR